MTTYEEFEQEVGHDSVVEYIGECPECQSTNISAIQTIDVKIEKFVKRKDRVMYFVDEYDMENPNVVTDRVFCNDCHWNMHSPECLDVKKWPAEDTTQQSAD